MTFTFQPEDTLTDYLSVNVVWPEPEDTEAFNNSIQQIYRRIADGVNCREIANYVAVTPSGGTTTTVEAVTGQFWFGSGSETQSLVPRQTFRKVVDFGALPNTATKSVAHGVTFDADSTMTKLYAVGTDPTGPTFISIPFADTAAIASNISLTADGTNVNITTGSNRINFTRTIVVIEYLKNL